MEAFITTIVTILVTMLFIRSYMRKRADAPGGSDPDGAACPRCRENVPTGALYCPGCGIAMQVYEMVGAPLSQETGEDDGQLKAIVRADVCVGCTACIPVCPEQGAIAMQGKLAVVDKSLCVGHGKCADACPVGAIIMATGEAVHRVEMPDIGLDFQSNVPGVYIVGELGGRGLIKNAINEGKLAIESVARELKESAPARTAPNERVHDVIIVGSGPAGLSAGLEALRQGLDYALLDQGTPANTIRKYPRHKLLLAEPVNIPLFGDLWVRDASKEDLIEIWDKVIARSGLVVQTDQRVTAIEKRGEFLAVSTNEETVRLARRVVLAMGRRGTPRKLGVPGEEREKVFYDVAEMEVFRGKHVLVVGGGDSAIESALGACDQEGAVVTLSYRGEEFKRAKDRNREKLDAAAAQGKIAVLLQSQIQQITEGEVTLALAGGESRTIPNDNVVIRVGGEPPFPFLERIGIRMVSRDVAIPRETSHA